jgi:hypothetical protein
MAKDVPDKTVQDTASLPDQPGECSLNLCLDAVETAAIDAWRHAKGDISRLEAVGLLVKIGLDADSVITSTAAKQRTSRALELATTQIDQLIDPAAPPEERDRRLTRLIEGPPEFVEARVDLPTRKR